MKINEIMEAADYQIIEGSVFLWKSYGENARSIDFSNNSGDFDIGVSCVFDKNTKEVYEVNVLSADDKNYRWVHKEYVEKIKQEFNNKNLDFAEVDGNKWVDLDNEEDVIRKIKQVIQSGCCDNEITIALNLDNEVILGLSLIAHKRNITLNALMVEIVEKEILKKDK